MKEENLTKNLKATVKTLNYKANEIRKRISKMPSGKLYVCSKDGKPYFYYREGEKKSYISKDCVLVKTLSQKEYFENIYKKTKEEIRILNSAVQKLNRLHEKEDSAGFKKYKKPYVKEFRMVEILGDEWKRTNQKDSEHIFSTDKGDYVRSKAEVIIANMLNKKVPYIYEKRMIVNGHVVYPDFYVMNERTGEIIIIEHLGKMGDQNYARRNIKKLNDYIMDGFVLGKNLLITMETDDEPLNIDVVKRMIKQSCQ
ncbi:MAG: hypothetical protein K6F82_05310 [Sphaerochaetaceae bacterium]|nr:hypothetical protein [Sphaerochaetaceae bacterium]